MVGSGDVVRSAVAVDVDFVGAAVLRTKMLHDHRHSCHQRQEP